jgi:iron complex outermembrane receptor protein
VHQILLGPDEAFNIKQVLGNYDQTPYFSHLSDHHSSMQSSGYLQDEFPIRDDLLLSAGIRYDQYSTFGGTVNPRLALTFHRKNGCHQDSIRPGFPRPR